MLPDIVFIGFDDPIDDVHVTNNGHTGETLSVETRSIMECWLIARTARVLNLLPIIDASMKLVTYPIIKALCITHFKSN